MTIEPELRRLLLRAWCATPDGYVDPPMINDVPTMEAWGRVARAARMYVISHHLADQYHEALEILGDAAYSDGLDA